MVIYADVVFAVNATIDFLMLQLGARLTGYSLRPMRAALAAVIGGGYAVCVLLPSLTMLGAWWGKILCLLLMLMVAYGFRRKAAVTGAAALLCGGALAGFVFLLMQVLSLDLIAFGGFVYYPLASRMLILMSGIFYLAAALLLRGSMKHSARELLAVRLRCGGKSVTVKALLDTGNSIMDPIGGKPVVVLDWQRGVELLDIHATKDMFCNAADGMKAISRILPECRLRLLPYKTVGRENGMLLAAPCKASIGRHREVAALAAISPNPVSDGGGYEALIGGAWV